MKKALLVMVVALAMFGCGEKDEKYFSKNIERAEEMVNECEAEAMKAIQEQDKDALKEVIENTECQAAKSAVSKYKMEKYKLERELKQKELAAKKQAIIDDINKTYGDLSWRDFFVAYNEKNRELTFEQRDPMRKLLEKKQQEAKEEVGKKEYDQLVKSEEEYCLKDKRHISPCTVYKKVMREKEKVIVADYVKNYEKLKKDFNVCATYFKKYAEEKNYKARNELANTYPCALPLRAARDLGITYSYNKSLK